jgi:hypothetical protein
VSGNCPPQADVNIALQAFWCDPLGCRWTTVKSGSGRYNPGGGSGKRANARLDCANASTVGWRGGTDVDLPGIVDPGGRFYTPAQNLPCSPPG